MEQRKNRGDMVVGVARLPEKAGPNGLGKMVWGWALPGGGFTADRAKARKIAAEINRMMGGGE